MPKQLNADSALSPWMESIVSAPQILVGLSGGLDSVVLLALLCEHIDPQRICALHINHGLSPNADLWQALAAEHCDQIGVLFHAEKVEVRSSGEGIEAAARHARYAVFERLLEPEGLLFLAHHADDQIETVLYRLLRGSGPKGLSGMPNRRSIGAGTLIRPLLPWRKSELQRCAQQRNLQWIEDESNADNSFDRNYLRNKVIPNIALKWPDYAQSLQRSAQLGSDAEELSKALAGEDILGLDPRVERAGWSISIESLQSVSLLRQRNILRHWSGFNNLPMPGPKIIDEILESVISARRDAEPKVVWQSQRWARFQGRLYMLREQAFQAHSELSLQWDMQSPLVLAAGGLLCTEETMGRGLSAEISSVQIRYRQGGERCKPVGRAHSNSLKKLLQAYGLQPWWRDRIPLLYVQDKLVAVGDLWVCEGWSAGAGEKGLEIDWQVDSISQIIT